jgi:hypothetical protein
VGEPLHRMHFSTWFVNRMERLSFLTPCSSSSAYSRPVDSAISRTETLRGANVARGDRSSALISKFAITADSDFDTIRLMSLKARSVAFPA